MKLPAPEIIIVGDMEYIISYSSKDEVIVINFLPLYQ